MGSRRVLMLGACFGIAVLMLAGLSDLAFAVPRGAVLGSAPIVRGGPPTIRPPDCGLDLQHAARSFTASPSAIQLGQSTTVTWNVEVPESCRNLQVFFNGGLVGASGSRVMTPEGNTTYDLHATFPTVSIYPLGAVPISVILPPSVTVGPQSIGLFLQAIGTSNETVNVQNDVAFDLSNVTPLVVAGGVKIMGVRDGHHLGPRLFTSARPRMFFEIGGDQVRISGLRIEGPDANNADASGSDAAVFSDSHVAIEIDHNEIDGWAGSAVEIQDHGSRLSWNGPPVVIINDNYIHNNQQQGRFGYGVSIGAGAYALIEHNILNFNRHAITSDGSDGSGYRAYGNLVGAGGGVNHDYPGHTDYIQQFDVHGQDNCGIQGALSDTSFNCGVAGHDTDIQYNAFLFTHDLAIKLRGTPQLTPCGMNVAHNVFAQGNIDDAVDQETTGLCEHDNTFHVTSWDASKHCDFDGDGIDDTFVTTGETWWYVVGRGVGYPWVYLNTQPLNGAQVTLVDVNGDHKCDVLVGGRVSLGGVGPWQSARYPDLRVGAPISH
jgi:hypothetical protein